MRPSLRVFIVSWVLGFAAVMPLQTARGATPPAIKHVFVIVLENEGSATTFGENSPAKYLKGLAGQGAMVTNYYGIGHASLDNYIAMISGQAPNPATQADCGTFADFVSTGTTPDGQEVGIGCVYPAHTSTLANQLEAKGLTWKGYMEDMGNIPDRDGGACGHPALGANDLAHKAAKGDQYATRHNPFVYFHALIDHDACAPKVVNARALADDLKSVGTTPNFAFITPNLCQDGHDGGEHGACVDGAPGGLVSADHYLAEVVPMILNSPAFKQDGLLIITFDEAEMDGKRDPATNTIVWSTGDARACCSELPGPNIDKTAIVFGARDQGPGVLGPGGGQIGAVMLSPFIASGTVSKVPYNHYSLLRSLEDIFGVTHLGYAGQQGLKAFGKDIFTAAQK